MGIAQSISEHAKMWEMQAAMAGAVLHFSFTFPMLRKLLLLLGLNNAPLFMTVAGICIAAFALFYMIVYKFTSNAYYSIVKHK